MDIFDLIGPIMVGPSSSHTAGAVRIGLVARRLLGEEPVRAELLLHGSFADTGHTALRMSGTSVGCNRTSTQIKDRSRHKCKLFPRPVYQLLRIITTTVTGKPHFQ